MSFYLVFSLIFSADARDLKRSLEFFLQTTCRFSVWWFGMEFSDFPYIGNSNPKWWTPSFLRGVGLNHQAVLVVRDISVALLFFVVVSRFFPGVERSSRIADSGPSRIALAKILGQLLVIACYIDRHRKTVGLIYSPPKKSTTQFWVTDKWRWSWWSVPNHAASHWSFFVFHHSKSLQIAQ